MPSEWEKSVSIFINEIFIFNFSSHHYQGFDKSRNSLNIKTLIIWKKNTEAEREGNKKTEICCEKLEKVLGHCCKHLHIDSKGWKPPHHQHKFTPDKKYSNCCGMVLPSRHQHCESVNVQQRVLVEADHDHVDDDPPLHPVLPVAEVQPLAVHKLEDLLS